MQGKKSVFPRRKLVQYALDVQGWMDEVHHAQITLLKAWVKRGLQPGFFDQQSLSRYRRGALQRCSTNFRSPEVP